MPRYFGHKGHNKQLWQFQKKHPQVRILQKEAKACMNFFDQIDAALRNQRVLQTLDRTLPHELQTATTSTMKQSEEITLPLRTKTAQHKFIRRYPKTVMVQPANHQQEVYPSTKEVMSVAD